MIYRLEKIIVNNVKKENKKLFDSSQDKFDFKQKANNVTSKANFIEKNRFDTQIILEDRVQDGMQNRLREANVLWFSRILLVFIIYMYHSSQSIIHLTWVLFTFLLPENIYLLLAITSYLPLMLWEFIFVYAIKIPIVQETKFVKFLGQYYVWDMKSELLERLLMFTTLSIFSMQISSYYFRLSLPKNENYAFKFFNSRCLDPQYSIMYKFAFLCLKHVQALVLFVLFYSGTGEINTFKNLSFMIFFVIFTAYEDFYRKYNKLLTLFVSSIILIQYSFSLYYKLVLQDKSMMRMLRWFVFFPIENSIENPFNVSV